MDNIELILTDLGEEATKRLFMKYRPFGIKENMIVAREGANIAGVSRRFIK